MRLVVAKRFLPINQLEENNSHRPNVHLVRYLRRVLLKALRGLVPVSSNSLGRQLYLLVTFIHNLAEPKVSNFDFTVMKNDVLWFEIVVNDFLFAIV